MLGIISGPVLYLIWKRMYGGLAKKDPVRYPVNSKTGLAVGDMKRISYVFLGLAAMGGMALLWLPWFEGEWGPDYYLEKYETGFFSNFEGMISAIQTCSVLFVIIGIVCALVAVKVEPKK